MNASHSNASGAGRSGQGLALALFGGMVLSFDIPLIKLANGDVWSVMVLRSFSCGAAVMLLWVGARLLKHDGLRFDFSRAGLAGTGAYMLTSVTFLSSVFLTSTANVAFILAFSGMFAVLLGWVMLGERPPGPTLAAVAVTILGVALIVGGGLSTGNWLGDALALTTAFGLALAITITRKHQVDMRLNVLLSNVIPAVAVATWMAVTDRPLTIGAPWWTVLNGFIVIPVSFLCLAYAPKLLYGPIVAMAYLLETIFAPIWVWAIFKESPTDMTLIGGSIMLSAILAHTVWELRQARR
ncbi:MAG: DMT family transporter [Rhizobiaceae bacterium]|jgi:drug/metabolite transporter (DMT)-like permease|nr:DMT family transporter [Rhizobiaceae bacterium]